METLFTDQSPERVYYVDMVQQYEDKTKFDGFVSIASFISSPTAVDIRPQFIDIVRKGIKTVDPREKVNDVQLTYNWTDASKDSIRIKPINLTNGNQPAITPGDYKKLLESLAQLNTLINNATSDQLNGSRFLTSIVGAVCMWRYSLLKPLLGKFVDSNPTTPALNTDIKVALKAISNAGNEDMFLLMQLGMLSMSIMKDVVANKKINDMMVHGLNETDFTTSIYYILREALYNQFDANLSFLQSDNQKQYFKRALVSLYITSFYPMLHFNYIETLMEVYRARGDFVNLRVAAMVRIPFVMNILARIKEVGNTRSGKTTLIESLSQEYPKIFENIEKPILTYMQKLSQIDFKNADFSINAIAMDLHDVSAKVASQSEEIDYLKQKIADEQLEIRAYGNIHQHIRKVYKTSHITFWISVAVTTLVLFVGCLSLLFMPSTAPIVSIVMSLLMSAILLYNVIVPLIYIAKSFG